jgi:ABC-type Na+ efflux pump permease subunit
MTTLGKTLIVAGVLIAAAGLVVMLLGRIGIPLGRLPGDVLYRGKRTTFYFPLATSLLLSVLLSLAFYVIGRMRR